MLTEIVDRIAWTITCSFVFLAFAFRVILFCVEQPWWAIILLVVIAASAAWVIFRWAFTENQRS